MRKISDKHRQWLIKELPVLESAGVISPEKVGDIKSYYDTNTQSGIHWAIIVFAVLGSLLIGSGIILLFAHNWDELTRPTRAVLSFCPILIGAILSFMALRKNSGVALRESAGIFHSLAIGASIALIGQTYHLPSNVPAFLLTWSLLILPLMFLLRSTGSYLIYLALICGWSGVAQKTYGQAAGFWLLAIPPIVRQTHVTLKNRCSTEASIGFAGGIIALCFSMGIALEHTIPGIWTVTYSTLLSAVGLLGVRLYGNRRGWNNIPRTFGLIGIALLAYLLTWEEVWHEIGWDHVRSDWYCRAWGQWIDGGITAICIAGWIWVSIKAFRRDSIETITIIAFPLLAGLCFVAGSFGKETDLFNALVFNVFMLYFGVMYIVLGCRSGRLIQVNGGMAIVSLLLVTRFFDSGFGYLARGVAFILLGVVFLGVNLVMVRRKNRKEVSA